MKKIQQLRHFMPLAGPGQRELATGDESPFRVSLGFTPEWFHKRLGIDFSEKWHKDPIYRYETLRQMKREVHLLFPQMPEYKIVEDNAGIDKECATISGAYGVCAMGAVYGLPIVYGKDTWPDTVLHYTKEELSRLKPISLENNPFVHELFGQMDIIEKCYGKIEGYIHYQGILNTAFRLMGEQIFIEMLEDESFAEFLFEHIYETTLGLAKLVQKRQESSGVVHNIFTMADCTINLIGTDLYEEMLLPYELKMEQEFDAYGIHTCNWDATRYFDSFQQVKKLGYLDMGMMSDMKQARRQFPNTRLAILYHPNDIADKPLDLVRQDFEKIRYEASPCDLMLVDIGSDIKDERLLQVVNLAKEMEREAYQA